MEICPDVIAFVESPHEHPDRWVMMNIASRTSLGVGPEAFEVVSAPNEPAVFGDRQFRVWEIARFSNADGLLADPARFIRGASRWGKPVLIDADKLVDRLCAESILIDDPVAYRDRFGPKQSLLDRHHFGNYHEQLGQHLLIAERQNPAKWWVQQKFTEDLRGIRSDSLYGAVQDRFLAAWLPAHLSPGMRVLDLGCGPGVIANKMARLGADVLGVDPNAEYIRLAAAHAEAGARFETRDLNRAEALDNLPSGTFDVVLMSDALLFYFVPYQRNVVLDVKALASTLLRLLKPGGRFVSLEPHPVFYLLPWLGAPERPFTVMNEYLRTSWRINPPLTRLARPFLEAGFLVRSIEELGADPSDTAVDVRARHFASEFPLWLLLEMIAPDAARGLVP